MRVLKGNELWTRDLGEVGELEEGVGGEGR